MRLCYLATPYTLYPGGLEEAYYFACEQAAILIRAGIPVVSPIAHSHGIAVHGFIDPTDHQFWLSVDESLMAVCDFLIVCKGDGWRESRGIAREIKTFREMGKPVLVMAPGSPELRPLTFSDMQRS